MTPETYENHPAAELFPMMDDMALAELADDIKANGLLEAIERHDGKILDGRNRLAAGIGLVYFTYNGKIDEVSMIQRLAKYRGGPSALLGDARGLADISGMTVARAVADRVITLYNSGRQKGRLEKL
jgi:hypothetical protein